MTNPCFLSIVIPAYNEEKRISRTLEAIIRYGEQKKLDFEVWVVDDGSADFTAHIVKSLCLRDRRIKLLHHASRQGKGAAVKTGVLAANGEWILFSDADLSTPIEEVEKLMKACGGEAAIAIGSRALKDSRVEKRQLWLRQSMGKTFNLLVRLLLFNGIKDTQCGFKLFKKEAAKALFPQVKIAGFAFDVEVLFLAKKGGFKVQEVPVIWRNSPQSKVHIVLDPIRMLIDIFRIRWGF
jgi:dolichyl-phosphate beta-glucosyltransferase